MPSQIGTRQLKAKRSAGKKTDFVADKLDFESMLPDWESFPVWWLAKRWCVSDEHWHNLIDDGEMMLAIDLLRTGSSRSLRRVTRASLLEFLNRRKDLKAVAEANPKPAYRAQSKRKPKARLNSQNRQAKALQKPGKARASRRDSGSVRVKIPTVDRERLRDRVA